MQLGVSRWNILCCRFLNKSVEGRDVKNVGQGDKTRRSSRGEAHAG